MTRRERGCVADHELEQVCAQVPELAGPGRRVVLIPGGMTNHNHKVSTPAGDYVVRIGVPEPGELGIDRDNEHHNSILAAQTGVGAPVIARVREPEALVVGYLDGVTMEPRDFEDPRRISALAGALRSLHAAPPFARDFDMVAVQARYLDIVARHGYPLPEAYGAYADRAARMGDVLTRTRRRTAPCHNDLMPGNFIEASGPGSHMWIVDYEYSGNNDPCYDLGDAINELELSPARAEQLVTEYFGAPHPREAARARLWSLMSKYGWSLWGAIRIGTTGDPEIIDWARALWARAVAEFESPDFELLLAQAEGSL
jgi:thiamine kinase-like enzyme